jgi:hypothetical protein
VYEAARSGEAAESTAAIAGGAGSIPSMTLPRASAAGVVLAALWSIAALGAAMLPMTDPDTWWHIRVGREILESGAIPRADTWSIAGAGREWVSQDWLSNVLMAVLFAGGGPTAVSFTYGVMTLGALWLVWNAIGVRDGSIGWLARAAWLILGLVLAAPVVGARVQVIDLLLAAAALNLLWRYLTSPRTLHLAALPLVAVAWVNLHAGWPLLFLLGGAVVVGDLLDRLRARPTERTLPAAAVIRLVAALGVSALALMLNPNGIRIYLYPIETLGLKALSSFIGEWQPASLAAPSGQLLALFVLVGVVPALLQVARRGRWSDALILVGLVYMAVTAVRFLLVAGPLGAAVACVLVSPSLSASGLGAGVRGALDRLSRAPTGPRGAVNAILVVVLVVAGAAVAWGRIGPDGQAKSIAEVLPTDAVDWLEENDPGDRVFNRYEWGGYLGLHRPDQPIFIDGRADVYGDAIIREYIEVISVNVDPMAIFDGHAIDHVLYPPDSALGDWLDGSDDWRRAYEDDVAVIWVRD